MTCGTNGGTIYACCNESRKAAILNNPTLNGIDFLEVLDSDAIPLASPRQQTILVHCLKPVPTTLVPANILITGGETILNITALWIAPASAPPPEATALESAYFTALPDAPNVLVIRTSIAGDFSPYVLRLVNDASQATIDPFTLTATLDNFDPQLASVTFRFKVECGPHFDCAPDPASCPPDSVTPPPINYLAKDYGTFRTVMLDRLSQLLPGWASDTEADLGVAMAELVAYVGDRLSYWQDAIATEAYLETARSRISLRRHALLVDYTISDGCNARTWIQLQVLANPGTPVILNQATTRFYTYAPGMPTTLAVGSNNEEAARLAGVQVFEPMQSANLYAEHNLIHFYTWGDTNCCLPTGATEATLLGSLPNLKPGDVLLFEEVLGPQTADPADADLRHRCAVRLTQVITTDGHGNPLVDPLFEEGTGAPITSAAQKPTPVTEIQWAAADALAFPVCISSTFLDASNDPQPVLNVSVAYGNVVLADHGLTFPSVAMGTVPAPSIFQPVSANAGHCDVEPPVPVPVRYRPSAPDNPITQAVPIALVTGTSGPATLDPTLSATDLATLSPSAAVPVITLNPGPEQWTPAHDLLESSSSDHRFVVEIEADGEAKIRFGDNVNGASPVSGTTFTATYRIGNGTAGNVGADSVHFLATSDARIQACRNPLPARGGVDPETNDQIRRRAPQAFLTQQRAITMQDYENVAEQDTQVDRAVASLRWTGSWYTVFIAVEPANGGQPGGLLAPSARKSLKKYVNRYRLAGQDLELDGPQYLSLEISLEICVDPAYFRADVEKQLLAILGCGTLANGTRGLFYPDSFTFGQTVYLSPIYAAARSVAGVTAVRATVFQPQGINTPLFLNKGEISLGPLQVARLENDPSRPNHGRLTLSLEGGKG